jgi:O-antigen/teichoic acid export membrane protein
MSATAERISSPEVQDGKYTATQKNIRGSSILLAGRFLSLAANFAIQVLTVRALSKSDYGAFGYALSVVSFCSNLTVVGLDKTISRFVPIYQ